MTLTGVRRERGGSDERRGPFNAFDDDILNHARAVERNFEIIHNSLIEIIRYALELAGEINHGDAANAPRDILAAQRLGGIDKARAESMIRLHKIRGGLQHWYPEMAGPEIHQGVSLLISELPHIERQLARWLNSLK